MLWVSMTRGVLLACSERKRSQRRPLPAIERYDGPLFRVLRKAEREGSERPAAWVLSARFGIVRGEEPIPRYDRRMTPARAEALRGEVRDSLRDAFTRVKIDSLFVAVGSAYAPALADAWGVIPERTTVERARGSIGGMAGHLYDWLHGKRLVPSHATTGSAALLGVTIAGTPAQILQDARDLLKQPRPEALRVQNWFVPIDDRRVAPKWLVSELTGLPVARFRSADAVRVLRQLGVDVIRV